MRWASNGSVFHAAPGFLVAARCFGDRVAGIGDRTGDYGTVGGCPFNYPQGAGIGSGAPADPSDSAFDAGTGGGKIPRFPRVRRYR